MRRRKLLAGAGVAVGLPLLDALRPSGARAHEASAPVRLVCYYAPNGIVMSSWRPPPSRYGLALSDTLSPLAGLEDRLVVVSGLANRPAIPTDGPGGHETGTTGFLTASSIDRAEDRVRAAISMDQVYAAHVAGATSRGSLQLGIEGGDTFGNCANGFACAYSRSISWAGPTAPLPPIVTPRVAFAIVFAGFDPHATAIETERRRVLRRSVLDAVLADTASLRLGMGPTDRAKLDEYLEGVRALELRIERGAPSCPGGVPELEPIDVETHVGIMNELIVLALRCDATRVVSFMLGNSASNRTYPQIGIPDGHHDLSHHAGNDAMIERLRVVDRWQTERLADLLFRMDAVDEGDGSLLDHSILLFSSEMSSGNMHDHTNLPVLLAGSGGGRLRADPMGRHLELAEETPLASLHLALLRALGVSIDRFGDDGDSPLEGLT